MIGYLDGVSGWDGNGLHAPQEIGRKLVTDCHIVAEIRDGRFQRVEPQGRGFRCSDRALRVP